MRPQGLASKIFLDSGDPKETKEALELLGFLDGQTTNPSLIAKNPETAGRKFSKEEILDFYKKVVTEVSGLIPNGSVSIEVYADVSTTAGTMFAQAKEFFSWIPNAHIKFPTTAEGLSAAERAIKEGMRVNMTLCFTQAQAAAVYTATKGAKKGDVFVSPFVGRLDDRGERGMDLIANIMKMYAAGDGHVEVLTASIRSLLHQEQAVAMRSDITTTPLKVLREWKTADFSMVPSVPEADLAPIAYSELSLDKPWHEYDIRHDLTDKGIERFAADWNALIA